MTSSAGDPRLLRSLVINWLLAFASIEDLPLVDPGADIGALDRSRYERRLDLVPGSLSIGRFERDFPGRTAEEIGVQLLDEAYLGRVQRLPVEANVQESEPIDESTDLGTRFAQFLSDIRLEPSEVLMLTGSPDVALAFNRWGVVVPELRRHPGHTDFTRFGLAIVGRGQAGHKVFEPWTQQIRSYEKHVGPTMLTAPSSNVSGILDFLHAQRASIERYTSVWHANRK